MNLSMASLVLASVLILTVVFFGADLFTQSVLNSTANGGTYNTQVGAGNLTQISQNYSNTMSNFTSNFYNNTNGATGTPTSTNPWDTINFAWGKATGVVQIVNSLIQVLVGMIGLGTQSLISAGFVAGWLPGVAIIGVVLLFAFAGLAYVLRWFV